MKKQQTGRSMVEMLGVLAVIGILSIAGVSGYGIAMRRMESNQILDVALKFSAQGTGKTPLPQNNYVLVSSLSGSGLVAPSSIANMKLKYSRLGKTVCITFSDSAKSKGESGMLGAFKTIAKEYIKETNECKLADGKECCESGEITFVNEMKR